MTKQTAPSRSSSSLRRLRLHVFAPACLFYVSILVFTAFSVALIFSVTYYFRPHCCRNKRSAQFEVSHVSTLLTPLPPSLSPQTPSGLPTANSYVTAPSIPPCRPPTRVSPYMGYSATTSAYVTGPTWQPASGSAPSPHSCDIASPLAFKSVTAGRDAIHPVAASAL